MNSWSFPNDATPVGSTLYYGIRFSPPETHRDLALLASLHHTLTVIPSQCRDASVAQAKLQWWREEMERIHSGQGQHPLSQSLSKVIRQHALPREPFVDLLDAAEADITPRTIASFGDLEQRCRRQRGALFELFARCHDSADTSVYKTARQLGAYVQIVDTLRNLGLDLGRCRLLLPADLLHRYKLNRSNLHWEQYDEQRRAMLHELSDLADQHLANNLQDGNGVDANALIPARIMAAISQVVLDELRKRQFPVLQERFSITPLRKVWVAWRARRRTGKA